MSDNRPATRYGELDWIQSVEDESESDRGSRSTSSTLSWTDDAEREISEEMKAQFELFESALYSELDGEELPEPILNEVAMWKQHSPHLRINGVQITPTYNEVDEKYPEDYEEVFAIHSDQNDIADYFKEQCTISDICEIESPKSRNDLNEVVVDQLFEAIWPDILKNVEPNQNSRFTPSPKILPPKKDNKSFRVLDDSLQKERRAPLSSRSCLSRHDYKCNHIVEREESTDQSLKSPTVRHRKLSPARFQRRHPSCYSASRAARRISTATSARLPKRKSLAPEFAPPNIPQISESQMSDSGSVRHGILPPIQAIPITPKLPNKRANSAMLRFSKTYPRTRPNTSRNKALFLTPIDDSDNSDKYPERNRDAEVFSKGDGHLTILAPPPARFCSGTKQNRQTKAPRRWRY
ncbi:uncharacterized protein isoform X2 [Rhodnius prolixus]|uniref:uncharacterized protein isoform X2 n=1 Tax=Rhodnius prolixus TaxID=13249 RepID=UPI003D187741